MKPYTTTLDVVSYACKMYGRDITPPPSGRISSSSGSPDSLYKSSTDSSRTLSFSPDSHHTSTAFKPLTGPIKLMIDDDSDTEWDSSFASPLQKRPPSVRKIARARSRLSDTKYSSRSKRLFVLHLVNFLLSLLL